MKLSLLQHLALFARRRYRAVFVASVGLVALSAGLAATLSFNTDMLSLLPQRDPAIKAYVETLQDFGSNTFLLVAVRLPPEVVAEPYQSFADELAVRLKEIPEIKQVQHRIGQPEDLLRSFFPKSVLFLDPQGRERLAERLSDEGIRQRVVELRRQLSTPQGIAVKELAKLDPLGVSEIFLDRLQGSRGALNVDWTSGYYISRDHRLLLLLAEPVRGPQDIPFDQRLAKKVEAAVAKTTARWGEIAGENPPPRPEVVLGGPYMTALDDSEMIKGDMVVNIATSALGVLVLFLIAFRRPVALFYGFVPLIAGLVLTFGLSRLTIGSLSSVTSIVAPLLIGLGIDFVIVNYGRYIGERQQGADLETALLVMAGSCSRGVLVGALTTTATFYAFGLTEFEGLRQMGFLCGTGILFCALTTFVLLPAMLAWSEDRHARQQTDPNFYLRSFGFSGLTRLSMRHPGPAFAVGAALTVVAALFAWKIQFDEGMKTMRPKGNRGIEISEEVAKSFGSGFDSMQLVVRGKSVEEVIELADRAEAGAKRLVASGTLYGFSGVTSLIPPPSRQHDALAWLAARRGDALDPARIRQTFATAAMAEGMRLEPFGPGLDLLIQAISLDRPIELSDFEASPETKLLVERFLKHTEHGWKSAVYLYPPSNRWRREAPPDAVALAKELGPQASLSGTNLVNQRVREQVIKDAWRAGIVGLMVVAIILYVNFLSWRQTITSLVPLLVGILWMVGGMALLGVQMNFINIFVTTMIIGIGVDYGVHVLHRYRDCCTLPWDEFESSLVDTGKAVMAAAMSTIIGFGSIIFSHYPGLQSTGKVAILGALFTSLVAITLLPAYLGIYEARRRGGRGNPAPESATAPAP
jgi:predicted RND superfamily exporter protein